MASLYKLPVVWVCENNQYAIGSSVPRSSASESMSRKAKAYRMPTYTCDGMDFFKMQSVAERAIRDARAGKGPSFIEAKCYRYRGHSMSDPATYRSKEEVDYWKSRDPIPRLKAAIQHDFDAILEDMVYVLNFIQDVRMYKEYHPDRLYVEYAMSTVQGREKLRKILTDAVSKFLDYAIELKTELPQVYDELISEYVMASELKESRAAKTSHVDSTRHVDSDHTGNEYSNEELPEHGLQQSQ